MGNSSRQLDSPYTGLFSPYRVVQTGNKAQPNLRPRTGVDRRKPRGPSGRLARTGGGCNWRFLLCLEAGVVQYAAT